MIIIILYFSRSKTTFGLVKQLILMIFLSHIYFIWRSIPLKLDVCYCIHVPLKSKINNLTSFIKISILRWIVDLFIKYIIKEITKAVQQSLTNMLYDSLFCYCTPSVWKMGPIPNSSVRSTVKAANIKFICFI